MAASRCTLPLRRFFRQTELELQHVVARRRRAAGRALRGGRLSRRHAAMAFSGSACLLVDLQAHSTRWPPPADAQRLSWMWRARWPAAQFGNPSGWLICSWVMASCTPRCGRPALPAGRQLARRPAAFVRVEVLTGVPEPFQRLDQPLRVEREQGSRVDLLDQRGTIGAGPVLAVAAANADPALEVVDLLGLNYARGLEQGADNEAALVPAIRGRRRPASSSPAHDRLCGGTPSAPAARYKALSSGCRPKHAPGWRQRRRRRIDAPHGRDDRCDRRRCLGGLDNGGRGNGQWCGHANRSSWAGSTGARGGASSGAEAVARIRARCAALKANQKPCPCRRARHSVISTRAVCLACAAPGSEPAARLDAVALPYSAVQCCKSPTALGP